MSLLRFLVNNDYFGGAFEMTIDGNSRTKTVVGFFFSMLFFVIILFSTVIFTSSYVDTSQPRVLIKDVTNDTYTELRINHDPVYYFITAKDQNGYLKLNQLDAYVNINVQYELIFVASLGQLGSTPDSTGVEPCKGLGWFHEIKGQLGQGYSQLGEEYGICASDQSKDYKLYNGTSTPYGHVEVQLQKCLLGAACKTAAELENIEFTIYMIESYFDQSNYNKPLSLGASAKASFRLFQGQRVEYRFFIQDVKVSTDTGILLKLFNYHTGYQVPHPKLDRRKFYPTDQSYLLLNFFTSGRHVEYTRVYYKLLDLFSDIGGMMQIVAFVIVLLYSNYNDYVQKKNLVKHGILGRAMKSTTKSSQVMNKPSTAHKINKESENSEENSNRNSNREDEKEGENKENRDVADKSPSHAQSPTSGLNSGSPQAGQNYKLGFGDYMTIRTKKLFNVDDHDFEDPIKMNLISKKYLTSSDELTNKRAAFYSLCKQRLDSLTDIYEMSDNLNSLCNIKDMLMTPEHKVLAHYASLEFINAANDSPDDMTYREAIKEVLAMRPANSTQRLLNEYMIDKIKIFENKFNGEVHNNLKEVSREINRGKEEFK